jgi:hypothetical protein
MMSEITPTTFKFATDEDARDYLQKIVECMIKLFNVRYEDCIECINEAWSHLPMIGADLVYRESPEYWANTFIFGKESYWWIRDRKGHGILKPLPYWTEKIDNMEKINRDRHN